MSERDEARPLAPVRLVFGCLSARARGEDRAHPIPDGPFDVAHREGDHLFAAALAFGTPAPLERGGAPSDVPR
jgi:hypothetical protein